MKINPLEKKHLEKMQRDANRDALMQAHHEAHELVLKFQDDACTVCEDVALELISISRKFALTQTKSDEIFAVSLVSPDVQNVDLLYLAITTVPNKDNRYEVTSASDKAAHMFEE